MIIDCPFCGKNFEVTPRASGYAGKTRTIVTCPHCNERYFWKYLPQGPKRLQEIVELVHFDSRSPLVLEEYDCSIEEAKEFATHFNAAWFCVPEIARTSILNDWAKAIGSPFVWLLNNRREWGGRGWGATWPDGHSIFVVDSVARALSGAMLETLLIHELGHVLFISQGEPNHCIPAGGNIKLMRCEKLVWDLTAAWGINIDATERWMMQNFDDSGETLLRRDQPLSDEEVEKRFAAEREVFKTVADFQFPAIYEQFTVRF